MSGWHDTEQKYIMVSEAEVPEPVKDGLRKIARAGARYYECYMPDGMWRLDAASGSFYVRRKEVILVGP